MTITRADAADRMHHARSLVLSGGAVATSSIPLVPRGSRDDAAARQVERLPSSTDYQAFLASVPAASTLEAARETAVRATLDALREAFSGPYLVDGAEVTARPMFRMLHPRPLEAVVRACAARVSVPPWPAIVGQCSPGQLVRLTQALIDDGRLRAAPGDVSTRIRQMQWDYGIGVDCAGYARNAIVATAARAPRMYGPGMESFRDLDGKRAGAFARHSVRDARAGDLITLDEIPPERYGHNVVVYSNTLADASSKALLAAKHGARVAAFLALPGPHHVLEVDSSWGAGRDGDACGGFRRDTWIYDVSAKTWGSFDPRGTPPRFEISPRGPSGDAYHATYRPR